MGRTAISSNLSAVLFSRVKSRVLAIILGAPEQEFSITEVIARAGSGTGAVQRELEKLSDAGIVALQVRGGRKVYRANQDSPIFQELRQLVLKTSGLVDPIRDALASFESSITCAFVYGSIARGNETAKSDIDLMIIGTSLHYSEVFAALQTAEKTLGRPINPNLMTPEEWRQKANSRNSFIANVLNQPKLFIIGTENELGAAG